MANISGSGIINGTTDQDSINGSIGNDTIDGGAGSDVMIGGRGDDIYVVDSGDDLVSEVANGGTDTIRTNLDEYGLWDTLQVERLTYTGTGDFYGYGDHLANTITGGIGNDWLSGSAGNDNLLGDKGNDELAGGAGNDTMVGGAGDDLYQIDATGDVVTEAVGAGMDSIVTPLKTFSLATKALANVENLSAGTSYSEGDYVYSGNKSGNNFNLTGNALNNVIKGSDGLDFIVGGNDTLNGGAGADTLIGGTGDDIYVVDNTGDVVTEISSEGTDLVQSSITFSLATIANVENITLTGTKAINATGNSLDNTLTGNKGANVLNDDAGNDSIAGMTGNDSINGGSGDDWIWGGGFEKFRQRYFNRRCWERLS